ncbi:MAG: hypothetical protein Kow00114_13780 [Kiloniellaceae bacterium]
MSGDLIPGPVSPRSALAVGLAGVAGMVAYALAGALFVDPAQLDLLAQPGFYLVGIVFVVPLPLIYRFLPGAEGAGLALLLLTVAPAYAAKQEGEGSLAWPALLALTFVYALTALVVYRLVAGPPR